MDYKVEIKQIAAQPIAVVRRRTARADLPRVVPQSCGEVWNFVKAHGIPAGRHVAVYLDSLMNVEIGVEVSGPFAGDGNVVPSALPAGTVATTAHFGPYQLLGNAYQALDDWCKHHGREPIRPFWEVYGHWTDDVTKLRTDVFYLLEATA